MSVGQYFWSRVQKVYVSFLGSRTIDLSNTIPGPGK